MFSNAPLFLNWTASDEPIMSHHVRVRQPDASAEVVWGEVPSTIASRDRRLPRRLIQLYAGLALYGFSMALMVRSRLGNMPWDVLHQGIANHAGRALGTVSIA